MNDEDLEITINGRKLQDFKDDGDFEITYGVDIQTLKDIIKNQALLIHMFKTDLKNIVEVWDNCMYYCRPMNNCSSECKYDCNCEFSGPLKIMDRLIEKYDKICSCKIEEKGV